MPRPTKGELEGAIAGGALDAATGRKGAILGALIGVVALSQKIPLDKALNIELSRLGYRSVTVYWTSPFGVEVMAARDNHFHRFQSEAPGESEVERRLDALYDGIVAQASSLEPLAPSSARFA